MAAHAQMIASGSSANTASSTEIRNSLPLCVVTTSNHASMTSIADAIAATGPVAGCRRKAKKASAASTLHSRQSKPIQARL